MDLGPLDSLSQQLRVAGRIRHRRQRLRQSVPLPGQPCVVGLGKRAHRMLHVVRLLLQGFRVPLAAGLREEVSAVDMEGSSKNASGIVNRVDGFRSQSHRILDVQRLESGPVQPLRTAAEERIVLLSTIDPYHRPHVVIVGEYRHSGRPDYVDHSQV